MNSKELLEGIRTIIREELRQTQAAKTEILTVLECAKYLNLTPQTIYKRAQIDLPCSRNGKRIYFIKSDLDRWISENRKPTLKEMLESKR